MAEKSPAFQFYPKDYLTDAKVVAMTPEIRGLYVQLLCHDWLEDGIYPDDICALSGFEWFREDGTLRDDWNTIEQVLNRCFIQHPTDAHKITNPRLLRARQEQLENREKKRLAGIESGKARKSKELSLGTDVRLCSSKKGTQSNSSSSSSSSSSSNNINITPIPVNGLKPIRATFNPEGKTKYHDWVYLSPDQYERVKNYYKDRGLGKDLFDEAIRELDNWFSNNPKMRPKRTDDAKALMGWPLNNAIKRKRELIYLDKATRSN